MSDQKNSLLQGTVILAVAAFISKFLGFIYKAFLARMIGGVGLGLYEKAYPVYTLILTISIVGIPVAISKLVSEKRAEGKDYIADYIFRIALRVSFIFGLVASVTIVILAKPIARYLLADIKVYYSIIAIAPAIFIVSIMATYRGYFQGLRKMKPTGISQVIEQLIRMTTMILLAYLLLPYGVELAAAGAASGAFWGSIGGLITILIIYYRYKPQTATEQKVKDVELPNLKDILVKIFSLALPVTIGALILPLMRLVDASMITRRLIVAGFTLNQATSLYGQFNGMAMTLVRFPTVIAASLAVNLVPAISEAATLKEDKLVKNRIAKAFKLALYLSIPASLGLFILARPLCVMIFGVAQAAISLRYVALGVVSVSLQQVTSSILQGFNHPKLPARNLFLGVIANAGLNYFLTAMPQLGIRGAAIGTVTGFTLAAILNIIAVFKIIKPDFDYYNLIIKPLYSSIIMSMIVYLTYYSLSHLVDIKIITTLTAVLIGAISYGMILLFNGGLTKQDLELLPKIGSKLASKLDKLGLVRG
ncbi:membrane protein involved in the export of O-antigen and teichoic acid [Halobacteroides halobius DSM 5150]|uniref:Membrane protein involved in the export of O-antigen and teichoic acid n=1 Tax=Halobacteroides halobius (strain ATCC 35273 / DSM 5150 / MD-1) TaxID=748449 RepID=L0K6G0_HALHC|nr:polysaccharide biosynthesis protein [Halobacteroides halobius]AGB40125.1 membrane protein involved in the export of O-antigen and teichoic acid [Halobacteroides halobius DSM 5150]